MLRREFFHSVEAEPGTLLLFRHVLPHAGTKNESADQNLRVVLFDTVVNTIKPPEPEEQHFVWQQLEEAFRGKRQPYGSSLQFLASILQHRKETQRDPLQHHPDIAAEVEARLTAKEIEIRKYLQQADGQSPARPIATEQSKSSAA